MQTDSEIIDKIIRLLQNNGTLNFNGLVRKVGAQRIRVQSCLDLLVIERLVNRKSEGKQEIVFKLNKDYANLMDLYQKNAKITKKTTQDMIKEARVLCKQCDFIKNPKENETREDQELKELIHKNVQNITSLLDGIKITSILLAAHPFTKTITKNLNTFQKIRQETLKDIFTLLKKRKISMSILIRPEMYQSI